MSTHANDRVIVSYLTLRRVVGVLGVALPILLMTWGFVLSGSVEIQNSISDYYAMRTRDLFVGTLFVIAWFLFAYKGHERKDDVAGDLACLFAMGVALFPNSGQEWEAYVHFASAAALFSILAYFSGCLFTKSGKSPTPRKKFRNKIYVACSVIMISCIVLIGLYKLLLTETAVAQIKPVFWLESFALWAFGCSWFVKGETLWRDPQD